MSYVIPPKFVKYKRFKFAVRVDIQFAISLVKAMLPLGIYVGTCETEYFIII